MRIRLFHGNVFLYFDRWREPDESANTGALLRKKTNGCDEKNREAKE